MSKLSGPLKALISAPFARPDVLPAPSNISTIYERISREARRRNVSTGAWLSVATAATMTLNSPDSLAQLYTIAWKDNGRETWSPTRTAEFMREVGLKCISFNGIPRTINMLGAFRASLPETVVKGLSIKSTRKLTTFNIYKTMSRGSKLWASIYEPHQDKLLSKLNLSHPDLPVHILQSHYSALLSDPDPDIAPPPSPPSATPADFAEAMESEQNDDGEGKETSTMTPQNQPDQADTDTDPETENQKPVVNCVGRIETSLVAVACLRAQGGVSPQVTSHVYGLRKGVEQLAAAKEAAKAAIAGEEGASASGEFAEPSLTSWEEEDGLNWLASDEGCMWVLETVDSLVEAIGGGGAAAAGGSVGSGGWGSGGDGRDGGKSVRFIKSKI